VNKLIIATSGTLPVHSDYKATLQIIVERAGVAKAVPGVYWSDTVLGYAVDDDLPGVCAARTSPLGASAYTKADGATAATPIGTKSSCSLAAVAKAVYMTSPTTINVAAGQKYVYLDMPAFNYALDEIAAGDVVKVKVTLSSGCDSIGPFYFTVGTFGCGAVPVVGAAITCPYVTSLAAWDCANVGTYWNGIAIVNTNASAGNVTLTAYKNDGTSATATVAIPANQMVVKTVNALGWVGTTPDGVPAYITATSTDIPAGSLSAFVMMADGATNSMGYLCR
jgi:hypothetical protein